MEKEPQQRGQPALTPLVGRSASWIGLPGSGSGALGEGRFGHGIKPEVGGERERGKCQFDNSHELRRTGSREKPTMAVPNGLGVGCSLAGSLARDKALERLKPNCVADPPSRLSRPLWPVATARQSGTESWEKIKKSRDPGKGGRSRTLVQHEDVGRCVSSVRLSLVSQVVSRQSLAASDLWTGNCKSRGEGPSCEPYVDCRQ